MANYELRNSRLVNRNAYHDIYKDGIEILHGKLYRECFDFVLINAADDDYYSEPNACPEWKGDFVKNLRTLTDDNQ